MSLSDLEEDDFKPIDIHTLDQFEDEVSTKTEETEPDFDRFKMLFDPADTLPGESEQFEVLYSVEKEEKADPFKALIEPEGEEQAPVSEADAEGDVPPQEPEAPAISPEEAGFEQGFAKGMEEGLEKGRSQGYDDGFAKGEKDGLAKGEKEGFAKGEPEGFAKGEAEGRAAGEQAVEAEAHIRLDALSQALIAVETALEDVVATHERQILELIFKIAQKAVLARLDSDDEVVRHTILDALTSLAQPQEIELSVSNEDYDYIEMIKDSFFEAVGSLNHVAVKSDPMVKRGGCRIETETASVSTDPESKLDAVYQAVKAAKG